MLYAIEMPNFEDRRQTTEKGLVSGVKSMYNITVAGIT